jgi:endonuclease/exonuclease/phosphatase family metal-dependent hydrolase
MKGGDMANSDRENLPGFIFRILHIILIVVFGLQMMRLLLSSMVVYLREIKGVNSLFLGPVGLGIFALSLLAPLIRKLAGSRKALWIITVSLCVFRILEQVFPLPSVDIWLAAAGVICFILSIPIAAGISWNKGDKIFLGTAFFLGIALDSALLIITSTIDLSWYTNFWALLVIVIFSLLLLFSLYRSLAGKQPVDVAQGSWQSSLALAGFGPWLVLQLLIFQNIPRLSASMQINTPLAGFVIALVNGIALTGALLYHQLKFNRLIKLGIPGILLVVMVCIPKPMGFSYLVYLCLGQAASMLLFLPLSACPEQVFHGKINRLGISNFIGQFLFVILIFIYYLPYDIALGFRSWVILPVTALFFLLFVLIKPGSQSGKEEPPAGILIPALSALSLVIIPLFFIFTTRDARPIVPSPGNKTVRVLTYNLYNGYNVDGVFAAEEHARLIEKSRADIVALEEVIRGMLDWNGADMLEWLSKRLDMPYVYGYTTDVMAGNAILSRYPIIAAENFILQPDFIPTLRGCLKAEIDIGGSKLIVMATHLYHLKSHPEYRTQQVARILELWNKQSRTVIMGDFNTEPGTEPINLLASASLIDVPEKMTGSPVFTHPSRKPERQIDYIWTSPDLKFSDFVLHKDSRSDHLALSVQITIP